MNTIFASSREDFFKIFFASLLVFALSFNSQFLTSSFAVITTVYLLDGGHVYATLLEVYGDPEELRKGYVWIISFASFFLNLIVLIFFRPYFFHYIFYFTTFHNMRQGLGVSLLYRRGEKQFTGFFKHSYYFLTCIPFILFHCRPRDLSERLSENLIMSFNLNDWISPNVLVPVLKYGTIIYAVMAISILIFLTIKKQTRGLWSMYFFGFVYAFSFLVSKSEFQSYLLLIFSHSVPYYFLMEKRIAKSHSIGFVKKFAWLFVFLLFAGGGWFDSFRADIFDYFWEVDVLIRAFIVTPLIAHFLFDAMMWKRDNERFKLFLATE